jgi:MYXO-CTERM domain-containing protein
MRASADISAYADDRNPGIATYSLGSWTTVGGTSASSPFSAALFTAAGHGDARATFVYAHADAFTDVTQGSSGGCGSILCTGAVGWDGPTGLGTPDQGKLVAIGNMVGGGPTPMIGYPSDGATLMTGFTIQMGSGDTAVWTQVQIDGSNAARLATAGTTTAPLWVTDGSHTLTFTSYDQDHNSGSATITVTVGDDTSMMGGGGGGGCCSASGGGPSSLLLFAIGAFAMRRRRQS